MFIFTDGARNHGFLLLLLNRHLEVEVILLLRGSNDLALLREQFHQDFVGLLLSLKSLSELVSAEATESDGLMAARCLNILFAEHVASLVEMAIVSFQGSVILVDLLIDETHLQEDVRNLGVVLSST